MSKTPEFAVIDAPAETFKFKVKGSDKLWSLPTLASLSVAKGRAFTEALQEGGTAIMDAEFGLTEEYCPGLADLLTIAEHKQVMQMWYKASGITLGE